MDDCSRAGTLVFPGGLQWKEEYFHLEHLVRQVLGDHDSVDVLVMVAACRPSFMNSAPTAIVEVYLEHFREHGTPSTDDRKNNYVTGQKPKSAKVCCEANEVVFVSVCDI